MNRKQTDDQGAAEAFGCMLAGIGFLIVGLVRMVSDISTSVPKGITVGTYHTNVGFKKTVGIPHDARLKHTHVVGATGTGKTTLLKNLIIQDIRDGNGLAVIDPKGDLIDEILAHVPESRFQDVIICDPTDTEYPIGFNIFEYVAESDRSRTASEIISIFKKLFGSTWGYRLENILRNTVLALLEVPGSTLLDIPDFFINEDFRNGLLVNVTNFSVLNFWKTEFVTYSDSEVRQAIRPILTRINPWMSYPEIRNVIGQEYTSFSIRRIMDERKILLVNIPHGAVGEDMSHLLGAVMVSKIQLTAMSRTGQKAPFYLYVDEFQNFITSAFEKILTEARSFGLGIIMSNQYLEQLPKSLSLAIEKNIAVRLTCTMEGSQHRLRYETPQDELLDDLVVHPLKPPRPGNKHAVAEIRTMCRSRYAQPRPEVESDIMGRFNRRRTVHTASDESSFWGE